jgi:hypothetical protein
VILLLQLFTFFSYVLLPYLRSGRQDVLASSEHLGLFFILIFYALAFSWLVGLLLYLRWYRLSVIDAILSFTSAIESAAVGVAMLQSSKGLLFENVPLVWILMVGSIIV